MLFLNYSLSQVLLARGRKRHELLPLVGES